MICQAGTLAPEFTLLDQDGVAHSLKDYRGSWVLLYFYPKDNTSGCTTEACTIRDSFEQFKKQNAVVLGISADSVESHKKFERKYGLSFTILSDENRNVLEAYGAWGTKSFMGKTFLGIHRISYLIDPEGKIANVYPKVKPTEHATQVLDDIKRYLGTDPVK